MQITYICILLLFCYADTYIWFHTIFKIQILFVEVWDHYVFGYWSSSCTFEHWSDNFLVLECIGTFLNNIRSIYIVLWFVKYDFLSNLSCHGIMCKFSIILTCTLTHPDVQTYSHIFRRTIVLHRTMRLIFADLALSLFNSMELSMKSLSLLLWVWMTYNTLAQAFFPMGIEGK